MVELGRIYRSRSNRRVAGVAGGLAEYFRVDPVLIRLIFVLLTFAGGPGMLLYIVLAVVMPEEPKFDYDEKAKRHSINIG